MNKFKKDDRVEFIDKDGVGDGAARYGDIGTIVGKTNNNPDCMTVQTDRGIKIHVNYYRLKKLQDDWDE